MSRLREQAERSAAEEEKGEEHEEEGEEGGEEPLQEQLAPRFPALSMAPAEVDFIVTGKTLAGKGVDLR